MMILHSPARLYQHLRKNMLENLCTPEKKDRGISAVYVVIFLSKLRHLGQVFTCLQLNFVQFLQPF